MHVVGAGKLDGGLHEPHHASGEAGGTHHVLLPRGWQRGHAR